MPGYQTRILDVTIGGQPYRLRALADKQQFSDPDGSAESAGISSASWSLFGQLWPAGHALAELMSDFPMAGKRVLELGCGLGLASIVLQRRGVDITASDHHPLAGMFLVDNARRNDELPLAYLELPWDRVDDLLGRFDLIIGADLLYERGQSAALAAFVGRHAKAMAQVIVFDPGRGNTGAFNSALALLGFSVDEKRLAFGDDDHAPFRGRQLIYSRGAAHA
jgi:predicted nicotinamide N-methyase